MGSPIFPLLVLFFPGATGSVSSSSTLAFYVFSMMIIRMQTKTFVGGGKHDWGKNPLSADTPFKEIDCISAVWPEKSENKRREH